MSTAAHEVRGQATADVERYSGGYVRDRAWPIVVTSAMLVWTVALFVIVRNAFLEFQLGRFDLGNMVQAVWSTTQGRPLEATTAMGEQMTRLGGHVDPILMVLVPLWILVPSPLALALVQIAAVSLGALPIFWLARKHLASETAAGFLALAYLASPWIAWTAFDAMHPKTLAIPLFLFAIWYLDEDRLIPFAVCALLAAASGELMGMTIAGLGVWYALARGQRKAGLAIAALGACWTAIALNVIVPAFSGGASVYYGLYESVGGSPTGVLKTAFTDPGAIVLEIADQKNALYVFLLTASLAGTFVLAPALALVAVPQLLVNTLADADGPTDPRHHYIAAIVPFLFAAAAIGLGRLAPERRVGASGLVLGMSVGLSVLFGPWPGGPIEKVPLRYELDAPVGHMDVLRRAVELIPDNTAVATSNKVGSHLAARRFLFMVPVLGSSEARAEWVVLDTHDLWVSHRGYPFPVDRPQSEIDAFRDRLLNDPAWEVALDEGGVYVFKRTSG